TPVVVAGRFVRRGRENSGIDAGRIHGVDSRHYRHHIARPGDGDPGRTAASTGSSAPDAGTLASAAGATSGLAPAGPGSPTAPAATCVIAGLPGIASVRLPRTNAAALPVGA